MFTLVIGGAASGKSEVAEQIALALPGKKIYLATMEPAGAEARAQIEKHRRQRAGKGFETVERCLNLAGLELPGGCSVLLECVGNLMANELYSPAGGGPAAVLEGVEHLLARCGHLTAVTNDVFSGGDRYQGDTCTFLWELARADRALALRADCVVEVVCGQCSVLKGAVPCG